MYYTDVNLHSVLIDLGGLKSVVDLLAAAVRIPDGALVQRVCVLVFMCFISTQLLHIIYNYCTSYTITAHHIHTVAT